MDTLTCGHSYWSTSMYLCCKIYSHFAVQVEVERAWELAQLFLAVFNKCGTSDIKKMGLSSSAYTFLILKVISSFPFLNILKKLSTPSHTNAITFSPIIKVNAHTWSVSCPSYKSFMVHVSMLPAVATNFSHQPSLVACLELAHWQLLRP